MVSGSDCGVRGPRFESHRGWLCLSRQPLRYATAVHTLLQCIVVVVVVVVVVTFFNHNLVNCKATLIFAIKIYEIKYNISLNDIHTQQ